MSSQVERKVRRIERTWGSLRVNRRGISLCTRVENSIAACLAHLNTINFSKSEGIAMNSENYPVDGADRAETDADVSRRIALARLAQYTAPVIVAVLTSEQAIAQSKCEPG